ncbi:MAG: isoprenylcysteine carboxylmethyltransferase family protein [Geobacter sp.]|nr:isoprenylcysteine carboxylmethyltransferase family protein [Geobacter sp.]
MSHNPWWKGSRGEWYLVVQAALFLLVIFGPRSWPGVPEWGARYGWLASVVGGTVFLAGSLLAAAGALKLGRKLTPLPKPRDNAELVVTGAYRIVRHPIYSGLAFMAFGWGVWLHSWLVIGYALLLFIFFDIKSRREERWLMDKFPEYSAYRRRVYKLIPFIY